MKRIIKVVVPAGLVLAAAQIPGAALADPGGAGKPFNECRTDKAIPDGDYEVNNNNFGGRPECLTGESGVPAFRVSVSGASSHSSGSDAFPDIFVGCSWGRCSPHSWLPDKVAAVGNPETTFVGDEHAGGKWGAGYDMFLDPRPIHDGQARVEAMIWLNWRHSYVPDGQGWPLADIDGTRWWVLSWVTSHRGHHWRYVQFRRKTRASGVTNLPLGPFIGYLERRGWVTPDWYLLNIEAGFEIWNGGTGLALTRFSVQH